MATVQYTIHHHISMGSIEPENLIIINLSAMFWKNPVFFFLIRISIHQKFYFSFAFNVVIVLRNELENLLDFEILNLHNNYHHHRLKSKTFTYFEFNFQIPCYYYLRIYSKKKTRLRIQNGWFFFLFFSIHSSHINILVMAITNLRPILFTYIDATTIERIYLCIRFNCLV